MSTPDLIVGPDAVVGPNLVVGDFMPSGPLDRYAWDLTFEARDVVGTVWHASVGGVTLNATTAALVDQSTEGLDPSTIGASRIDQAIRFQSSFYQAPSVNWPTGASWTRMLIHRIEVPEDPTTSFLWRYFESPTSLIDARQGSNTSIVARWYPVSVARGYDLIRGWQLIDQGRDQNGNSVLHVNGVASSQRAIPEPPLSAQLSLGDAQVLLLGWWRAPGPPPSLEAHRADAASLGLYTA